MQFRASDHVGQMLDAALSEHAHVDRVMWEATVMPSPDTGKPSLCILFWMRGPEIGGEPIQGSVLVRDPLDVEQSDIDEIVAAFLRQMREARSQMIADAAQQVTATPAESLVRGQQRSSGLLIP